MSTKTKVKFSERDIPLDMALKFLVRVHIERLEEGDLWFVKPCAMPEDIHSKRYLQAWRSVVNSIKG